VHLEDTTKGTIRLIPLLLRSVRELEVLLLVPTATTTIIITIITTVPVTRPSVRIAETKAVNREVEDIYQTRADPLGSHLFGTEKGDAGLLSPGGTPLRSNLKSTSPRGARSHLSDRITGGSDPLDDHAARTEGTR
jgi:hypothetical protein